jgi:hypothetical protein
MSKLQQGVIEEESISVRPELAYVRQPFEEDSTTEISSVFTHVHFGRQCSFQQS